jgi:hypothetical protein
MATISAGARRELVNVAGERYRQACRKDRRRVLDEFVALTGYHRKHAIRVLGAAGVAALGRPRTGKSRIYTEAVTQALTVLWEASDRVCGKRLKALLPVLVPALERHRHLELETEVRRLVLSASSATIDRLLSRPRAATPGRRRRGSGKPAIRRDVAVRTFADWKDPSPGHLEIDLVAHCGESASGAFANTLVMTDIATGWTECVALLVREGALVADALESLRATMPFPLRGIDSDNGSEFINETVLEYCRAHDIEFTRSRPHHKNDQAWVEQKNGAVVRRLVGYGRLEGVAAAHALARLYSASRLFVNFFQPSFKLAEKRRIGAKISKRYHPPETPCARLLASDGIEPAMKDRLHAVLVTLDPLKLLDEIRTVQEHIAGLATGEVRHVLPHRDAELEKFLRGLADTWRAGEVRPTHRTGPKPERHWRTRKDPFESVWPRIVTWLDAEPNRTAKDLLERLRAESPSEYNDAMLRTLQRRVKDWRRAAARRLVFSRPQAAALM